MNITINQQSAQAIYEQIVEQIKNEIIRGSLEREDALPSIRTLARELRVSVITTKCQRIACVLHGNHGHRLSSLQ